MWPPGHEVSFAIHHHQTNRQKAIIRRQSLLQIHFFNLILMFLMRFVFLMHFDLMRQDPLPFKEHQSLFTLGFQSFDQLLIGIH